MHLQKILEKTGLNPKEAEVYLACLKSSELTISEIARNIKIPRTSCYNALVSLQNKGLINVSRGKRRKYYTAENPKKLLLNMLETQASLKEVLPQFKALQHERGAQLPKPSVYFYENKDSIKNIFEKILAEQKPFSAITSIDDAILLMGDVFRDFIRNRYKKNIPVRLITHHTKESVLLQKNDAQELRKTRFLPSSYSFKTANFIYGDSVAIVSFNIVNPYGLIIQDPIISETFKIYFDILWDKAEMH